MKQAAVVPAQKADSVSIVDQPAVQKSATVADTISQGASSQTPAGTGGSAGTGVQAGTGGQAGSGQTANGGSTTSPSGSGTVASGGAAGGKSAHGGAAAGHVTGAAGSGRAGTSGTGGKNGGSAAGTTGTGTTGAGTAGAAGTGSGTVGSGSGTAATGSGTAGAGTKSAGTTTAEDSTAMAGYYSAPKKDKPAEGKTTPDIKNSNVGGKGAAGLASKYVLMLTTSQNCSISINNIPYGTLNNGRTMKLYLVPGAYVINATSTAHKSKQYTGRLEVKQEMLDQVGEFKIQL